MNPGNIERYRMFLAAVELGSMSAAAERLGYSSVEHFSAAFKQYYKMSASRYRSGLQEE